MECNCDRWSVKVLEPIKISSSRIIYRCRQCDGIVCWSDNGDKVVKKVKIRPKVEGYSDHLAKDLI
ncbi:MAG: hypothetical protein WBQ25_04150 [Nitrososphaeraceae archaeon]